MGNEHEILPTLFELLRTIDPPLAKNPEEILKIEQEAIISTAQPANAIDDMSDTESDVVDRHDESNIEKDRTITDYTAIKISEDKLRGNNLTDISTQATEAFQSDANVISKLIAQSITCPNGTWRECISLIRI